LEEDGFINTMLSAFLILLLSISFLYYAFNRLRFLSRFRIFQENDEYNKNRIFAIDSRIYILRIAIYSLVIILFIIGIFKPPTEDKEIPNEGQGVDILFIVDVSLSMNAVDGNSGRLDRFKEIIIPMLPELEGNRLGILVFAGSPFLYCPLTSDLVAFADYVKGLDVDMVGDKGTDIGKVFSKAQKILNSNKILQNRIIVLVSDGEDHENQEIPNLNELLLVWGIGSENGNPIYYKDNQTSSSGYVSTQGNLISSGNSSDAIISKANHIVLKEIAESQHGIYYNLTYSAQGAFLLADHANSLKKNKIFQQESIIRNINIHYYLTPCIILLLLDFLILDLLSIKRRREDTIAANN
jgi:Ca-activated chloride channel family protein